MKKVCTFIIAILVLSLMQIGCLALSETHYSEKVSELHNSIIEKNGGKALDGYCAQYVSYSLYIQGITTGFEAKGNGKDVYDNWNADKKTSGGYDVIKYSGEKGLDHLIEDYGDEPIYNVVVGFDYSPYGDGQKYGHVMYIYAIADGYLYYSESGTWYNKPSGTVFKKTLSEYKEMYSGHTYDGAILFIDEQRVANSVTIPDGTYSIRSACDANKALDIMTQSVEAKANVHIWDVGSQDSQKWKITRDGAYYSIVNVNSGKALDVENGDTDSGTNVWQYNVNGTNAQKWRFEDAGNGCYYIRSACGLYLDLYGADTSNGGNIAVYNSNGGSNNQKWKLISTDESDSNDTTVSVSTDEWGAWSEWSTNPVPGNDNRQVETGTAYVYYHYVLEDEDGCGAYPIDKATMKANGFTYYNEYYHEYISMTEIPRDTSGRLVYSVNGGSKVYDRFPNHHCSSDYNYIYANYLYYKGTTAKYRYRDRVVKEHTHTFSGTKFEKEHPHSGYRICTGCNEKQHTEETISFENCVYCNPKLKQIILRVGSKIASVFGKEETNDVAPLIVDSRTMLPARFVAESLGADVSWDESEECVIIKNDEHCIEMYIGSKKAYVDGKKKRLDSAPFTENGRTYCPVRFICEALDANVEWNPDTQEIIIEID